jgi:drug/metabolite transporter (DMT)-like permease
MAVLLALAAAFMWGASDFLGGALSRRLRALEVYGLAQMFGLALMAVVVVLAGEVERIPDVWGPGIGAGVVGLVGMVAFYQALAIGPMGVVSPIAALGVLVPLGYGVLRGESPSSLAVLGIAASVVGILLACGPELTRPQGLRPLLLAALSAVCFGTAFIVMAAGSEVSAAATMTVMRITTVAVCAVAWLALRWRIQATRRDLAPIASAGVLESGANLTFGISSTLGLLSITSVLSSLYPVVTALLAAVVFRERLRVVQYVGVAFAMTGVVLITSAG